METLNFFFQINVTLIFSCFHFILSKTWFWFKDCCKQLDTQNKWWRVEKPVSDFEFFWVVQIRQCTHAHLKIKWNVTTKCLIFSWNYDFIFFFEKASRVKSAKRRSGLVKKIHTDRLFIFHTITSLWLFTFYQFKQILQQFFENLKIVILFFGGWSWVAVMVIIVKSNYTSNFRCRFTLWQLLKLKNPDKTFFKSKLFQFLKTDTSNSAKQQATA